MPNSDFNFRNPKKPLTIFFIDGMVPTEDDKAQAATLPGRVTFRNVRFIDASHPLEPCDFVAGLVPKSYAAIPLAVAAGAPQTSSPATLAPAPVATPAGAGGPVAPHRPAGALGRRGRPPAVTIQAPPNPATPAPAPTGWATK